MTLNDFVSKAPLCKGQTPSQCEGDVATRQKEQGLLDCRANARLRDCKKLRNNEKKQEEVSSNPSVIFLRKCHLPLHKGGFYL